MSPCLDEKDTQVIGCDEPEEGLRLKSEQLTSLTDSIAAFLANEDYTEANALLLRCAVSQTQSECGFVAVVVDGVPRILTRQGIVMEEDRFFSPLSLGARQKLAASEFLALNALMSEVAHTGTVLLRNYTRSSTERLMTSGQSVQTFLGVPIYSTNRVVGVIGVANRRRGYTDKQRASLETLVQGAGILCETYRRRERQLASEQASEAVAKALRESDERFRLLVEGVKDLAILMLDPNGQIVSWSSGAEKLKHYPAAEIIGQHFSIFYPKADIATGKPAQALQRALTEGHLEEEGWRVRRDRTQFWAHVTLTALRDDAGNLRGFAKVSRDITERKYAEKILRESEERTRFIIESAHDAFVSLDPQGTIVDWNRQAERLFGWPREKVVGRAVARTILPPRYRKAFLRGLQRFRASGRGLPLNRRFELMALHREGREFPVEVTITSLRLEQGYILSAFLHDISERKGSQERLRQIPGEILRAEEAERKRVARELHDSVSQIQASAKARLHGAESASSPAEIRQILSATKSLVGAGLEEVRRIAHNLMPSELVDLGLMPAVRSLCASLRGASKLKIKLTYSRIPESLGDDLKLAVFRVIQEALNNIRNHAAATRVLVSVLRKRSLLRASVSDNGKGFDPQQSSSRSTTSGMGILNMQHRIAFVGGSFKIRSSPGRGTIIELKVPLTGQANGRKEAS